METINKPCILVTCDKMEHKKNNLIIEQLGYGIEEEGVYYQIVHVDSKEFIRTAYLYAKKSLLGVVIAINNKEIIIHYKEMKMDAPVYRYSLKDINSNAYFKKIGQNATRLVKRKPFLV